MLQVMEILSDPILDFSTLSEREADQGRVKFDDTNGLLSAVCS